MPDVLVKYNIGSDAGKQNMLKYKCEKFRGQFYIISAYFEYYHGDIVMLRYIAGKGIDFFYDRFDHFFGIFAVICMQGLLESTKTEFIMFGIHCFINAV